MVRFIVISSTINMLMGCSIGTISFEGSSTSTGAVHSCKGREAIQVVPGRCVGSLSNQMEPPINVTSFFAIAKPRPDPGAPPRCVKRSNKLACSSLGIPGPVSRHSSRTLFNVSHPAYIVTDPALVYLIAFDTILYMICSNRCTSPNTQSRFSVSAI